MEEIIRLQDASGRGPWRPGFSHVWMTDENPCLGKPIQEDFKDALKIIKKAHKKGYHVGCAMRGKNKSIWFSNKELENLHTLGFYWVNCSKCDILAESEAQIIIASRFPFKFLERV